MTAHDVRLLAASYRREGDDEQPVIELFGKTRDGRAITVEHRGFRPYFYVVEPPQSLRGTFERDSEVVELREVELEVTPLEKKACVQVIMQHPWRTPEYRNKARQFGSEVLAADIPFVHRFIYDMDLGSCFRVEGEETEGGGYTTEIVLRAASFEPCEPFNPTLKILSFDIENSIEDGHLLTLGIAMRGPNGDIETQALRGGEREILRDFVTLVEKEDPDVLSGYNIGGYDIPVLLERARKGNLGELAFGRDFAPFFQINERMWRLHGRVIVDAWWSARTDLRPKQETLDYVARKLLGEGKQEVDPARMDEEWERDPERVIRYCMKDAELSLRILEKLASVEKGLDLATVSRLPLDDVLNGRTSTLIDSLLIRAADRKAFGVPMTRRRGGAESIEGGYVHTIDPGLYEWVVGMDFRAMYPSLIIENNICFSTLHPDGDIEAPSGIRFLGKEKREGILPRILAGLMEQRQEIRTKIAEGDSEDARAYYHRLEDAVKVLMNAFYGVLASSFYRFTNPKIGGSITAFARENIKEVIRRLEARGNRVIYGDTDSVFFSPGADTLDGCVAEGQTLATELSGRGMRLEFERVFRSFFSHGRKKRYAGQVIWPEERLVVRGYEIRRTDAFDLQSEAQTEVLERVLRNEIEDAIQFARETIQRAQNGEAEVDQLVISRTVKDPAQYVNPDSMPNVQAARKLEGMGYEFVPGMKVSWIVVNAKKSPMEVEPYVSGRPFEETPDWEYYARRVAQTFGYITEVFGWDEKSLLTGSQQVTLFQRDFGKESKAGPRKTDRPLTLEDFM
ncbi:MAG: DNA polymerase domain-containing protein [Thermoplasmata archaeon]